MSQYILIILYYTKIEFIILSPRRGQKQLAKSKQDRPQYRVHMA